MPLRESGVGLSDHAKLRAQAACQILGEVRSRKLLQKRRSRSVLPVWWLIYVAKNSAATGAMLNSKALSRSLPTGRARSTRDRGQTARRTGYQKEVPCWTSSTSSISCGPILETSKSPSEVRCEASWRSKRSSTDRRGPSEAADLEGEILCQPLWWPQRALLPSARESLSRALHSPMRTPLQPSGATQGATAKSHESRWMRHLLRAFASGSKRSGRQDPHQDP